MFIHDEMFNALYLARDSFSEADYNRIEAYYPDFTIF